MTRRCALSGKTILVGNRVSHSNTKTKHRFIPNLQTKSLYSDILGANLRMRLSAHAMRTVDHVGGIDAFLLKTPLAKLPLEGQRLKKRVKNAQKRRLAAAAASAA
jgi:large subunit ribosomal protein L28